MYTILVPLHDKLAAWVPAFATFLDSCRIFVRAVNTGTYSSSGNDRGYLVSKQDNNCSLKNHRKQFTTYNVYIYEYGG